MGRLITDPQENGNLLENSGSNASKFFQQLGGNLIISESKLEAIIFSRETFKFLY